MFEIVNDQAAGPVIKVIGTAYKRDDFSTEEFFRYFGSESQTKPAAPPAAGTAAPAQ